MDNKLETIKAFYQGDKPVIRIDASYFDREVIEGAIRELESLIIGTVIGREPNALETLAVAMLAHTAGIVPTPKKTK